MSAWIVLVIAAAGIALVLRWSGRYGGRHRGGTSLKRRPRSHTSARGRPKVGYPTREAALAQAHRLSRDGAQMSVYQCDACARWHVGHAR